MATDLQLRDKQEIEFGIDESVIESVESRLVGLVADTPANYEVIKAGKAEVRKLRTGVEKAKKELIAPALKFQKLVNEQARKVIARLRAIEDPLDAEIERVEAEKRKAEQVRLEAERQRREAAEQKLREEEEAKRAAERAELEAAKRELAEAKRELEQQRSELQAEKDAIEAEQRAAEEEKKRKRMEADAARLAEERRPDRDKLISFADKLDALHCPTMSTDWGRLVAEWIGEGLGSIAEKIRKEVHRADCDYWRLCRQGNAPGMHLSSGSKAADDEACDNR